jgi:putative sigma-54 modulation protein
VHVRGKDIHCESVDADMYAAIDGLADKLDRAIVKHKEMLIAGRNGGGHRQASAALARGTAE